MNRPSNVKSEMKMMTMDDNHFAMWKEFIERHHHGELINPNTKDMSKEKKLFTLSTKFQLTHKFFKHFGYFIDNDFRVYV